VWIVNTGKMPATVDAVEERMNGGDLSRVAIAEPLYGTTLTHWSLLWNRMGAEELKKWHLGLKSRGVHFVKGNGAVRDLVAAGTCDLGMTDTDDFFGALDTKNPVAMLPIRVESCGAGVMQLIPQTTDEIHREKLAFFKPLTVARSSSKTGKSRFYRSWQESPLPSEWLSVDSGGVWDGISCAHLGKSLRERLRTSASRPGAYFSRISAQASVVVLPDQSLVVYSWWDI
jgi:hypothetical protein